MAIKLSKRARWIKVRNFLDEKYGIQVNFSDKHNTYYIAYRYVTKEDSDALHSASHPDLRDAPKTEKAIAAKKRKGKNNAKKKNRKEKRLSVYDVTQLIQGRLQLEGWRMVLQKLWVSQNLVEFYGSRSLVFFYFFFIFYFLYEGVSESRLFTRLRLLKSRFVCLFVIKMMSSRHTILN